MTPQNVWTGNEELLQRLRELVAEKMTARQIGDIMGVTRNAIIGAARRNKIKLLGPKSFGRPVGPQAPRKRSKYRVYNSPRDILDLSIEKAHRPRPHLLREMTVKPCLIDGLKSGVCRWPLWANDSKRTAERFYCGGEAMVDSPYCEQHRAIGTKPSYMQVKRDPSRPLDATKSAANAPKLIAW